VLLARPRLGVCYLFTLRLPRPNYWLAQLPKGHAHRDLQHGSSHNVADGLTTLPQDYAGIPRDIPRLGPPLPDDLGVQSLRRKANHHRSVLMPNNSVPNRKLRRHGPAKYLRRPQRPSRHRMPHPRKRPPRLRHLLMKPSLRTGRIANSSSSMLRLIGERQHPIGSRGQRPPLLCRRGRLFRQP
jgi:hypothetical protein